MSLFAVLDLLAFGLFSVYLSLFCCRVGFILLLDYFSLNHPHMDSASAKYDPSIQIKKVMGRFLTKFRLI